MHAEPVSIEAGSATFRVDTRVYGLSPLLRTVHRYTDRCHVHLEYEDGESQTIRCSMRSKSTLTNLKSLSGEFMNDVLDATIRAELDRRTAPLRALIVAQAFSQARLIHPELDDDPVLTAEPGVDAGSGPGL